MKNKNIIHCGDCIELMQQIEPNSVNLIIADPPYNLGKNFGNDSDRWQNVDDWLNWSKLWLDECIRVLQPTGNLFVYGIHRYLCYVQCYLYEKRLHYQRQIIWHYENGFSGYKTLNAFYEPILWFSKTDNFTFHEIREPYKSKERLKNKITKNGKIWIPHPAGRLAGDVWSFPTLAGKRFAKEKLDHPTQKPLVLCDRIVTHFSNVNDTVLIPFAGSGSECVSCAKNNRDFYAAEINKDYVKMANNRIAIAVNTHSHTVVKNPVIFDYEKLSPSVQRSKKTV